MFNKEIININKVLIELTSIDIFNLISHYDHIEYRTLILLVYILKNTVFPESLEATKIELINTFNKCIDNKIDFNTLIWCEDF